ncbi:PepSY domain-containing protein [Aliamphritea spongicola]|nr:PepSY domain-containing protein [Aliamphritea spongicola]
MWRQIHRWAGVILGLLLIFLAVTGSILSVDPLLKRFDRNVHDLGDMTVGDVLRLSAKRIPTLKSTGSGSITPAAYSCAGPMRPDHAKYRSIPLMAG